MVRFHSSTPAMPQFLPFASRVDGEDDVHDIQTEDALPPQKRARRSSLKKLKSLGGTLFKRHHHDSLSPIAAAALGEEDVHTAPVVPEQLASEYLQRRPSLPDVTVPVSGQQTSLRVVPSLPRPQTVQRQESERRERLLEIPTSPTEKRTLSLDRRRGLSASAARRPLSPRPVPPLPSVSAPDIAKSNSPEGLSNGGSEQSKDNSNNKSTRNLPTLPPLQIPDQSDFPLEIINDDEDAEIDQNSLQEEYDRRWILNLSMHFRDKSNREKFFVTYAETPTRWRRLTISLDYRNAPPDSLEADLSTLHYQRDKSFRIYEAIRESLPAIQYYNTVTNLKLETTPEDDQLHVHVREDANEIVQFPSVSLFDHVAAPLYPENDVEFINHLSGFVYKVRVGGTILIKKEIPGPDTVDEFLYEVNALDALLGCKNIIQLAGLVTDLSSSVVKGLLISYASQGALVDMIYDLHHTSELPWHRREKWAKQIVSGLSSIHEAGFVQGDFTLSNIVIDDNDDAQIIDINRRGCPVGWEPPELGRLINSGQRIGMHISVKTDLYQLGMVLWALAEEVDEPDRLERPLARVIDSAPNYFSRMVESCLSERPQGRPSAKRLLRHFPRGAGFPPSPNRPMVEFVEESRTSDPSISTHRSDKEYIDPDMAITLEDVTARNHRYSRGSAVAAGVAEVSDHDIQYLDASSAPIPISNPASSNYNFGSTGSWVLPHRGRSPVSSRRDHNSPSFAYTHTTSDGSSSSATSVTPSVTRSPPSRGARRAGSECSDHHTHLHGEGVAELLRQNALGIDFVGGVATPTIEITPEFPPHPAREEMRDESRERDVDARHEQLLHKDSGFDEVTVEEIESGKSTLLDKALEKLDIAQRRQTHDTTDDDDDQRTGIRDES